MRKIFFAIVMALMSVVASAHVYVYVIDTTGSLTNVRNAPGGKIVQTLSGGDGYVVELLGVKNGWWRIDSEVDIYGDNEGLLKLQGSATGYWIHGSLLSFGIAGDPTGCLRSKPSAKAKPVKIPDSTEMQFRPVAISGKWVKAVTTDGKASGWVHSDRICYNPLTTCP
ncbi:MAG: SH3 domain-containing protein [Muribaculaceae bacterium]|nr:SH3 domain-containing protein [Muribaculaceae bacterium]